MYLVTILLKSICEMQKNMGIVLIKQTALLLKTKDEKAIN